MNLSRRTVIVAAVAASLSSPALAHPPTLQTPEAERAVAEEITAFRKTVADAIRSKDAARLRTLYADGFTHTHTSGKSDGRDARIVMALSGDPVIETAEVKDLVVRVPNDWVAIATGTSAVPSMGDGKIYAVRWMTVYTRRGDSWVIAASQATRAGEIPR